MPSVTEHVCSRPHPPACAITHRRLAQQLDESFTEDRPRHARLARKSLDGQVLGIAGMDDRQHLRYRRVGEPLDPALCTGRQLLDIFAHCLRQEQLGQSRHHLLGWPLLGEEAHRTIEPFFLATGDIERQQRRQGL